MNLANLEFESGPSRSAPIWRPAQHGIIPSPVFRRRSCWSWTETRVPTIHFVWELSTLNSFSKVNRFLNRFFLQLFSSNSSQDYFDYFIIAAPNLAYFFWDWCNVTQILCFTIIYKRVGSFKKELPIHNSLEKRLKESILQLSTPESLGLYHATIRRRRVRRTVGLFFVSCFSEFLSKIKISLLRYCHSATVPRTASIAPRPLCR